MARPKSGEFDLIARYFAPLATVPGALSLTDDAAVIAPPRGHDMVVTKDAIVEGVHFLPDDPWDSVARKLLRVNMSDLAAKGVAPVGYFLATAFPKATPEAKIARFARGLAADQAAYELSLYGGDTVSTPGPAMFSCTMFGWAKPRQMLGRSGARPGDEIWVTGSIGDSGLGLAVIQGRTSAGSAKARKTLAQRYRVPDPPVTFGANLTGLASAAMDVSDGLLQDAGHLAKASGVAIAIERDLIPLSGAYVSVAGADAPSRIAAAVAGDDYQILFTASHRNEPGIRAVAHEHGVSVTRIGTVGDGAGVTLVDADARPISVKARGYTHF